MHLKDITNMKVSDISPSLAGNVASCWRKASDRNDIVTMFKPFSTVPNNQIPFLYSHIYFERLHVYQKTNEIYFIIVYCGDGFDIMLLSIVETDSILCNCLLWRQIRYCIIVYCGDRFDVILLFIVETGSILYYC